MPGSWGSPPMMYPPYPPWMGWYGLWTSAPVHFHLGWSGPAKGFGHEGYYTTDICYRSVGHQQDKEASRHKNRIVQNAKSDHPVSLKATTVSGQQHKQWVPEDVSSAGGSGGNQDQTVLRSGTSADDGAKHDTEKGPEKLAAK
jgi:hypothetical protein